MQDTIKVIPKIGPTIDFVKINIYQLVLNWGFKCVCYCLDSAGVIIEQHDILVEGEEYNAWLSDDEMTVLILSKIGLQPELQPVIE